MFDNLTVLIESDVSDLASARSDAAPKENMGPPTEPISRGRTLARDEKGKKNGKAPRKSNTPFQRIKVDGVTFANEKLKDNSFAARVS